MAQQRRGFTLLELTISLLAASFLLMGMGASLHLTSRAADPDLGSFQSALNSTDALAALQRELTLASAITAGESNERAISFRVPDVTGDGAEDAIRYEWSGTSGDPLRRSVNNAAAVEVAPGVSDFALTYHLSETPGTTPNSSGRQTWVNQKWIGSSAATRSLEVGDGLALWFRPTLPASATAWGVTQIELIARRAFLPLGTLRLQLTKADANRKPAAVLEEGFIGVGYLATSMSSHQIVMPGGMELGPSEGACLTLVCTSGVWGVADIRTGTGGGTPANTRTMITGDGGANWSALSNENWRINVWGTYTTTAGGGAPSWNFTSIDAQLTSGAAPTAHAGVLLLNRPEAPAP